MPRKQEFEFSSDASPEEVAAALEERTRFRLFPYQASVLGGGERPFGGRVGKESFRIALDPRSFFQHSQAVAVGKIDETATGGSRVSGMASLPVEITRLYRLMYLTMGFFMALAATGAVSEGGATGLALAAVGIGALVSWLLIGIPFFGWHVSKADAQVPELVSQLEAAVPAGAVGEAIEESQGDDVLERARRAAAAAQRQ